MPQPDIKSTIVAGPLANVSIAYRNKNYIADRVFPIIPDVPVKAKIAKFLKGAWFRDEAGQRAEGTQAPRGGYPTSMVSLACEEYAFAKEVSDETRRRVKQAGAPPMKPDQTALRFCADRIDLKKERLVAATILAGTWSDVAGEDVEGLWAAGASNTFIDDVETRIETIRKNTGFRPNVLMLSANILPEIKQESTVLDRIKYTERGIVTAALIAAMFELEEVLIGDAVYSSANEKADGTDFTAVNVWEKNAGKGSAFLYYRPTAPALEEPSAGYMPRENIDGAPRRTTTWREESKHQDVYEVAESFDVVQTGADLGFLWYDCIAT